MATGSISVGQQAQAAEATPSGSVRALAMRASVVAMIGYGSSQVLRLGSNLILARLLAPDMFGVMVIVNVFLQGLQMFSDVGIAPSIIQNPRGEERAFLNTAWTVQVIRGICLWFAAIAIAWPVAQYYDMPSLILYLPIAGATAAISGLNATVLVTHMRKVRLVALTTLDASAQLVALVVMVVWAIISPSPMALVAGMITNCLVRAVVGHVGFKGSNDQFGWDADAAKSLMTFGRWVFLSTLITFIASQVDRLALGKLITAHDLGLYGIAAIFARIAINVSQRLNRNVLFPILSRKQHSHDHLMRTTIKAQRISLLVTGAVCVSIALAAPLFFEMLYDSRYHECGILARWLVIYIWFNVLVASVDSVPLAIGRPRTLMFANVIKALGTIPALAGYFQWGIPGFVCGLTIGSAAAYGYLVFNLPARRTHVLLNAGVSTATSAACAVAGIALLEYMQSALAGASYVIAAGLLTTLPVLVAARIGMQMMGGQRHGSA